MVKGGEERKRRIAGVESDVTLVQGGESDVNQGVAILPPKTHLPPTYEDTGGVFPHKLQSDEIEINKSLVMYPIVTMVYIISIEGNIGSGKSTLTHLLSKHLKSIYGVGDIIYLQEPVAEWDDIRDEEGRTMLEKFYADQHRYAFSFQMMAYISRVALLRRATSNTFAGIIVTERSVETDREVFARMLHDEGKIEQAEYQIYLKWFDEFTRGLNVHGTIHLETPPTLCWERVASRSRDGETIPLNYLQKCEDYHRVWLSTKSPILRCDGTQDFKDTLPPQLLAKITSFIEDVTEAVEKRETLAENLMAAEVYC